MMIGLLAAKPRKVATFHFLYDHINMIILIHFDSQAGKEEPNNTLVSIEEASYLVEEMLFVSVFSWLFCHV
jgi:hypothetical protein